MARDVPQQTLTAAGSPTGALPSGRPEESRREQ